MTVCFTGHRPKAFHFGFDETHPDCISLVENIKKEVESLIQYYSADTFYTGMALGVDTWGAEAVIALKEKYPSIKLIAAIPFPNQSKSWSEDNAKRYKDILEKCDDHIIISPAYHKGCMHLRNEYMVDHSDIVLAVFDTTKSGGTASTVKYAEKQGKMIVHLNI